MDNLIRFPVERARLPKKSVFGAIQEAQKNPCPEYPSEEALRHKREFYYFLGCAFRTEGVECQGETVLTEEMLKDAMFSLYNSKNIPHNLSAREIIRNLDLDEKDLSLSPYSIFDGPAPHELLMRRMFNSMSEEDFNRFLTSYYKVHPEEII